MQQSGSLSRTVWHDRQLVLQSCFCSNSTFSENAVVSSVIECGCHSINNCNVCECNRIKYLGWIPFLCLTPSPLGFEGQGLGVKTYPYEMRRHLVTVTSSYIVASCCYITRGHKCWSQTCRLKVCVCRLRGFSDVFSIQRNAGLLCKSAM